MKVSYIAHPVGGDVEGNILKIKQIVRMVNIIEPNTVPFVPYFADIQSLDDSNIKQRKRGMKNDEFILRSGIVDELRLYGNKISPGMVKEVLIAKEMKIPVVAMNSNTAKELKKILNNENTLSKDASPVLGKGSDRTKEV